MPLIFEALMLLPARLLLAESASAADFIAADYAACQMLRQSFFFVFHCCRFISFAFDAEDYLPLRYAVVCFTFYFLF